MSDPEMPDLKPKPDNPQELVGFMSNDDWQDLLSDVNGMIQDMEELAFPQVKEQVFQLLAGIDTIHREALRRLVRLFKDDVLVQVVTDPAIHTLMELYDMLPRDVKRAEPSEFKFELAGAGMDNKPPAARTGPVFPHWVPAMKNAEDLADNTAKECFIDDRRILVIRAEGKYYACDSACVQDGKSLVDAELYKLTLTCPHHSGCHFDVRNGGRIGDAKSIECYNIKVDDKGRLMVGFDMDFRPGLPAF